MNEVPKGGGQANLLSKVAHGDHQTVIHIGAQRHDPILIRDRTDVFVSTRLRW